MRWLPGVAKHSGPQQRSIGEKSSLGTLKAGGSEVEIGISDSAIQGLGP